MNNFTIGNNCQSSKMWGLIKLPSCSFELKIGSLHGDRADWKRTAFTVFLSNIIHFLKRCHFETCQLIRLDYFEICIWIFNQVLGQRLGIENMKQWAQYCCIFYNKFTMTTHLHRVWYVEVRTARKTDCFPCWFFIVIVIRLLSAI